MIMRYIVSDTMKCKFVILVTILLTAPVAGLAQAKYEREFRIRKTQFPPAGLEVAAPFLEGTRRVHYYQETDSNRVSYEIKFKKGRLRYSVEFSAEGELEDIELGIKPVDIPANTWEAIEAHLTDTLGKHRTVKIQQQYPRAAFASDSETFRMAFQNMLLPEIRYEIMVQARGDKGFREYEVLYDHQGLFLSMRESLPPNYDHVLY